MKKTARKTSIPAKTAPVAAPNGEAPGAKSSPVAPTDSPEAPRSRAAPAPVQLLVTIRPFPGDTPADVVDRTRKTFHYYTPSVTVIKVRLDPAYQAPTEELPAPAPDPVEADLL